MEQQEQAGLAGLMVQMEHQDLAVQMELAVVQALMEPTEHPAQMELVVLQEQMGLQGLAEPMEQAVVQALMELAALDFLQ